MTVSAPTTHNAVLGFSIGGFVAQEIALVRPALVRRLVLAATGPKGAPGMHGWREDIAAAARGESKPENLLYITFAHTESSQAKGMEFLKERMNTITLAPADDFRRDPDLFGAQVQAAEAQRLIQAAMQRGLQTRGAEMELAGMLGDLGEDVTP